MTQPGIDPRPGGAPPVGRWLAVSVDRRKVDRIWALPIGLNGLVCVLQLGLVAFLLASGITQLQVSAAPFVLVLVWEVVATSLLIRQWQGLRRPGPVLVLDEAGLTVRSGVGEIRAPWHAVARVTTESRLTGERLRIRFVPVSSWPAAGVGAHDLDRRVRRAVGRHGLQYSWRVLQVDRDLLLRAFYDLSHGRVTPTAP